MTASRFGPPRRALSVIGVVAAAAVLGVAPAAASPVVPFSDPAAVGQLTLCDRAGHPVTSGQVHDHPFAAVAVGSVAAPRGYSGPGRTAALFGYQPIRDVAPEQWNGRFLTASAKYSNPSAPMAAGTSLDPSLADYLSSYPTKWDGLIQLRMFYGAPRQPTETATYATAIIKVDGDTWTLQAGGGSSCAAGTAVSAEAVLPALHHASGVATAAAGPGRAGGQATGAPTTTASSTARPGSAQESLTGARNSVAAPSGGSVAPWILGGAAALAAIAGSLTWWRRRRPHG